LKAQAQSSQRAPMTQNEILSIAAIYGIFGALGCGPDVPAAEPSTDAAPTSDATPGSDAGDPEPGSSTVEVTLTPRTGVSGTQRVNFAVPLARGQLQDPARVRVLANGVELSAARRGLARYADGSLRSVQLQVDTTVTADASLEVQLDALPATPALELAAVATTLEPSDGTLGPRVWARLPASWLVASGVTGPQVPESETAGTAFDVWDKVCDYQNHDVTEFLNLRESKDVWLYDRGTIMYRGYARRGDLDTLESAYRETAIYRQAITGSGASTRIGVPASDTDVKYHYAQNLAIHYLLTGDDRFRDAAEDIAFRIDALWTPQYGGGGQFWTERHAGFSLLAYVWARVVTDDKAAPLDQLAHDAVSAYLDVQQTYPVGWSDPAARCFAHETNCSPWMSAILADGLDAYATEYGGAAAASAHESIVKLGKILARDARDATGKPFYMFGVGNASDTVEEFDEHWGEPAYVIAMAWHHGGRTDASLRTAAEQLLEGLRVNGTSPHMRSFNWQCRSAMAIPYYLR
jgi:hypothetical protein